MTRDLGITKRPVQMRATRRRMLEALGITVESYHVEREDAGNIWGIKLLKGDEPLVFIEHEPRGHGGGDKYHVRQYQSTASNRQATPMGSYPTQREAIAAWLRNQIERAEL